MIYTPKVTKVDKFKWYQFYSDIFTILCTFILRMLVVFLGVFIVAIALPFAKAEGQRNEKGWQMVKLPRWAWLWSNDHDGVEGEKECRYQIRDGYGFGFWARYNWTALRNPANNFSRYIIGFHFKEVKEIEWIGNRPDADDDRLGWTYNRALVMDGEDAYWIPGWTYTNKKHCWSFGWKIRHTRPEHKAQIGFTTTIGPYKP